MRAAPDRQFGVRRRDLRRQRSEEHWLRETAGLGTATRQPPRMVMPIKLKGLTGKLQKGQDITPLPSARPGGESLTPTPHWQEVGRGSSGGRGHGDRRKHGAKASPPSSLQGPKADRAGQRGVF